MSINTAGKNAVRTENIELDLLPEKKRLLVCQTDTPIT